AEGRAGREGGVVQRSSSSSIFIAFTRETRIRLKEPASAETSSPPTTFGSGTFRFPRLTSSAIEARSFIGRMTIAFRRRLSATSVSAKTATREPNSVLTAAAAIANGTDIGTETIWAPMISFSFQPKPFAEPYAFTSEGGAVSGVVWHVRQFL